MPNQAKESINVNVGIEKAYNLWLNLENLPQFMEPLHSVERTGEQSSHWTVKAPLGITIEWDAEITEMVKNEKISWRTTKGDVTMDGDVYFTILNGQTEVSVSIRYKLGGSLARSVLERFFGNPKRLLRKNLRNFKKYAEQR